MELLFIISLSVLIYTYFVYGLLLKIWTSFIKKPEHHMPKTCDLPDVTHIIASYNEEAIIREKIENSINLNYPSEKLKTIFVTDGSTDKSMEILSKESKVINYHIDKREGKLAAVNRVIKDVTTEIIVFSDANALLNSEAMLNLAIHFQDSKIGAVAGEKKVESENKDDAAASGEGVYWKYESWLKKLDYHLYSVVGAAGELFAIRTALYQKPKENLLIEDFVTSMTVAKNGYRVAYAPDAIATEKASAGIEEELKRKIRISAGGLQAVVYLAALMNPFRYGVLSFQYISHRVFRWTLAPLALVTVFIANLFLLVDSKRIYIFIFLGQLIFYALSIVGYLFKTNKIKFKFAFIPFYFTFMNISVFLGLFNLISGNYKITWEKSNRRY